MTDSNKARNEKKVSPEVAAKNRRLAIFLGLVAVGIYVIFIFTHLV